MSTVSRQLQNHDINKENHKVVDKNVLLTIEYFTWDKRCATLNLPGHLKSRRSVSGRRWTHVLGRPWKSMLISHNTTWLHRPVTMTHAHVIKVRLFMYSWHRLPPPTPPPAPQHTPDQSKICVCSDTILPDPTCVPHRQIYTVCIWFRKDLCVEFTQYYLTPPACQTDTDTCHTQSR